MNRSFAERWQRSRLDETLDATTLQPRLHALITAPLVSVEGCLVLEPLVAHATGREAFEDKTAFEAFINKLHVDDFIEDDGKVESDELVRQSVKAAFTLSERLSPMGSYRVFLSLDEEMATAALRFFENRLDAPWASDDPEEFTLEGVLIIDP